MDITNSDHPPVVNPDHLSKANHPIVFFALLTSDHSKIIVEFYHKIGDTYLQLTIEDMLRKPVADIINLSDSLFYLLKPKQ